MKAIVTGAAGFIGSHLAEELANTGHEVYGIDNFHPYYSRERKEKNVEIIKDAGANFVEGELASDVMNANDLPEEVDVVFHLAAHAGVRNSFENPNRYISENVESTSNVVTRYKDAKIVFASSSSVYGEMAANPPVEEHMYRHSNPLAPYALSKRMCENMIRNYSNFFDINYTILRYFSVYGPRQRPDEAVAKFSQMILNDEPVTVYSDGKQSRDFTHVEDIVKATIDSAKLPSGDAINIGTGKKKTVNELVDALRRASDKEFEVEHEDQPEGDVRHTHANINKARRLLGYEPARSFEQGVKETFEWERSHAN